MMEKNPIVILSGTRTAMGHFGGYFKTTKAPVLGAAVIKNAIALAQLDPLTIQVVLMGCVLTAGQGQAPARQALLLAGLSKKTSAITLNKMCGSGMQAVMTAHDMIVAGSADYVVAGGMENMSLAPFLLLQARFGYRMGTHAIYDHMICDGLEDAYEGKPMGFYAEMCADHYKISREKMDNFAAQSLKRAKEANQSGIFEKEITPVTIETKEGPFIVSYDENAMKADPKKIPLLKPVFVKDGKVTAANSSSISDGAAALVITHLKQAQSQNQTPMAKIVGHATFAETPAWFTTAPLHVITQLLKKINWNITEVDLFEINEAFAVVAIVAMQELKIPPDRVNIHGGACALGHPIGASGARIIVTLLNVLKEKNLKRGIAAICIGGGEATAIAIEIM